MARYVANAQLLRRDNGRKSGGRKNIFPARKNIQPGAGRSVPTRKHQQHQFQGCPILAVGKKKRKLRSELNETAFRLNYRAW